MKSLISRSYLINIDHPLSARINDYTVRSATGKSGPFLHRRFTIDARLVITGAFPSRPRETRRECMPTEEI